MEGAVVWRMSTQKTQGIVGEGADGWRAGGKEVVCKSKRDEYGSMTS